MHGSVPVADLEVRLGLGGCWGWGGGGEHYGGMVSLGEGLMSDFFLFMKKLSLVKGTERIYTPSVFLQQKCLFLNFSILVK